VHLQVSHCCTEIKLRIIEALLCTKARAPTRAANKSGQYLSEAILTAMCKPRRAGRRPPEIHLHWIAGHEGVLSNEIADAHAKWAAAGESSPTNQLPIILRKALSPSPVALRQEYLRQLKKRWKEMWKVSPRFPKLRAYSEFPSAAFLRLLQKLQITRAQSSLLFQLRTGHIPLGSYLHRIKKAATPQHPGCGAPRETVIHYLFECPSHTHERIPYFRQWQRKERDLSFLLTEPKAALSVIGFVRDTKRLQENSVSCRIVPSEHPPFLLLSCSLVKHSYQTHPRQTHARMLATTYIKPVFERANKDGGAVRMCKDRAMKGLRG